MMTNRNFGMVLFHFKYYFYLIFYSVIQGYQVKKSSKEMKGETTAEARKRWCLVTILLSLKWHCTYDLGSPTSATNFNNPVQIWLQVNLTWYFLSWESFFPNDTTFCQVDIKWASELDPLKNFVKRWCYCSKIGYSHNIIVLRTCLKEDNRMLTVYFLYLQIMNWDIS